MTGDRHLDMTRGSLPARMTRGLAALYALVIAACGTAGGPPLRADGAERPAVDRVRLGSPEDARPVLRGPSYYLRGNGRPSAESFQAHIDQVAASGLDIVVLSASEPNPENPTPNCSMMVPLRNVNSCEKFTIRSGEGAAAQSIADAIDAAEIVYFAGGNQCRYVVWRGTPLHAAVVRLVGRGGGVGGGSAGLAIQGEYAYDGCTGSVRSDEALADPWHADVSFTRGLFEWSGLTDVITDSHFHARDRMGRLLSFLARHIEEGVASAVWGLGIEEGGTVLVGPDGTGRVYGESAWVILADHAPERCEPGQSLTYRGYRLWRLDDGDTWNFRERARRGYYVRDVVDGVIARDPYSPG